MKKVFIITMFFLTLVLLVGCCKNTAVRSYYDVSTTLPKTYMEDNKLKNLAKAKDWFTTVESSDDFDNVKNNYFEFSVVSKFTDGVENHGVYSIKENKLVLPMQFELIILYGAYYYN